MSQKSIVIVAAIFALMAGIVVGLQFQPDSAPGQQVALNFAYPDLDGTQQNISRWRGKILVINFWASWCGPCKQEIPEFIRWQQQYADRDVQFIGIAVDDREPVIEFLRQVEINYPILIAGDAGSALAGQLGDVIGVLPFTVIVDRQGNIVHRQLGELAKNQFVETVEPLLAGK